MATLLLVDDDPVIRGMFARTLQTYGDIDQAAGGGDALRLLSTRKYDIIMLDLHMPIIDGWVVLQMLANKPGPNRETPVFVVTADTSDKARVEALRRKAVFFLTKPVHLATLSALIDSALKKNAARMSGRPGSMPDIDLKAPDPRSRSVDPTAPDPRARSVDLKAPDPRARSVDLKAPDPRARSVDPKAGAARSVTPSPFRPSTAAMPAPSVLPGTRPSGTFQSPTIPNDPNKKR